MGKILRGCFRAIDQGNTALNIPQYNGGLFKQDEAIEHLNVSDQACEEFRDLLATTLTLRSGSNHSRTYF